MKYFSRLSAFSSVVLLLLCSGIHAQEKKALGITDIMKFRKIESSSISDNGEWVIHTARPDRGDPEVLVYSSDGKTQYSIALGEKPLISGDERWVAAIQAVPAVDKLKSGKDKGDKKQGMVLLNTKTGEEEARERVESFAFSNDSKWLVYLNYKEEKEDTLKNTKPAKPSDKKSGSLLNLISLDGDFSLELPFVKKYSIDSTSNFIAYTVSDTAGIGNGVYILDLSKPHEDPIIAFADSNAWGDNLSWTRRTRTLAFLGGKLNSKDKPEDATLYMWTEGENAALPVLVDAQLDDGWKVYHKNRLTWTRDGQRLFLGTKPESEIIPDEEEDTIPDLFDTAKILADRELDIWHWNDPLIIPNQKILWEREKDRIYRGVYHLGRKSFVQLEDTLMPDMSLPKNSRMCLGSSNLPHSKKITWDTRLNDFYLVNLGTGKRKMILEEYRSYPSLSPDGKKLAYFQEGRWYIMDTESLERMILNEDLDIAFANEDHDYPEPAPSYSTAGWVDGSEAVLIYDKYDIWMFPSEGSEPVCLTGGKGRKEKYQFRIRNLDPERLTYKIGEEVLVEAYHDLLKHTAVYSMKIGRPGIEMLIEEEKDFHLLSQAKNDDKLLYTRESYTEFPDLWVSSPSFRKPVRLSNVNPQVSEFAWGDAELVEWSNMDGRFMQGVLIKPGNYEPGKKYPVLVYYYRFMTDRFHSFTKMEVNHRPCFPYYASNGYAVFLPDIRFDIGYPGYSATKCLVPGVQKLIDMGIADPDGIALHGHSWSGYQTAFVITQTDMFACAIAGAPVSNMTSAYSGIRLESGLARQMQYEQSQSRIGGSLWEYPERYIENSPVFFADRINTPLMIQFGDVDGAVPWEQGIELYLAMRRLEKDCVFLQYRGEPHHLKKYPNKLDYTIKFKSYLDHYCKGMPAPDWLINGVPYTGK